MREMRSNAQLEQLKILCMKNKEKAEENKEKLIATITEYKNGDVSALKKLWELPGVKNIVKSHINIMYEYYGMDELLPVRDMIAKEDLLADAYLGLERGVAAISCDTLKCIDGSGMNRFIKYVSPFIKESIILHLLEESKVIYPKASRAYQNELVKVKKVKCDLSDSNQTINTAIKNKYSIDWSDRKIDALKSVYAKNVHPEDDLHKKKVNGPEDDLLKVDVSAECMAVAKENGASNLQLEILERWIDWASLPKSEKTPCLKTFNADERKYIIDTKRILKSHFSETLNIKISQKAPKKKTNIVKFTAKKEKSKISYIDFAEKKVMMVAEKMEQYY